MTCMHVYCEINHYMNVKLPFALFSFCAFRQTNRWLSKCKQSVLKKVSSRSTDLFTSGADNDTDPEAIRQDINILTSKIAKQTSTVHQRALAAIEGSVYRHTPPIVP